MFPNNCARCGADLRCKPSTMSKFNTDMICMSCKETEVAHPKYAEANRREIDEVLAGNYNFEGVGCPPELYIKPL